jgi:hypothetical protein
MSPPLQRQEALRVLGAAVLIAAVALATVPTRTYAKEGPSEALICIAEAGAALGVVENFLSPANALTVTVGTPVTFSSDSSQPLSFAIASSPALLSTPNVDSGPGSPGPAPPNAGGTQYSFTSTKASASAGTVYWQASFSRAGLPHCTGYAQTEKTAVRTLTVLPPPPVPTPPAPMTAPDLTPPAPVALSISSRRFHLVHPTVTYRIKCSEPCTGGIGYEVVVQRHHRAVRVDSLEIAPATFAINAPGGGEQQFGYRFAGAGLRLLRHMVQKGDAMAVELRVSARPPEYQDVTHAERIVSLGV